jgi:hypothetical protein
MMAEQELPLGDVKDIAEDVISDKRKDGSDEAEARDLYDLPGSPVSDRSEEDAHLS